MGRVYNFSAGPAVLPESVLKEARNITVEKCEFSLRYPLWHVDSFRLLDSSMDELTRAAIWYAKHGEIVNSKLHGIKVVRECEDITLRGCDINSPEFGWKCNHVTMEDTTINSEYIFFDSKNEKKNILKLINYNDKNYDMNYNMEL